MSLTLSSVRIVLIIIATIGLVVFLMSKFQWKSEFIKSTGTLKPQGTPYQYYDETDKTVDDISSYTDQLVNKSFEGVQDLRTKLLEQTIKASDVLNDEYIVPRGIRIPSPPKIEPSKIRADVTSPKMLNRCTDINEFHKNITDLPNWFETDQIGPSGFPM